MPLVIILGLPGTGKTYLATELIQSLSEPPIYLSTDKIRRNLFDFSHHHYVPFGDKLYTQEKRDLVYNALYLIVEILLSQNLSIIVDGTFYSQTKRIPLIKICQQLNQKYYIIKTTCTEEVIKQRIQERKSQGDNASDADFNIYLEIKDRFETITTPHLEIDTGKDLSIILKEVISYIADFQSEDA
ncbi:MAG: AAA family ATPase [Candidatus Heimdallarchaeota archaeon]|nr:MAG: AAA family ATPase [Candidatus Heimdallarchaeota archaeon]